MYVFSEFNSATENQLTGKLDTFNERLKLSSVYITGANGRIQSGAYSDQLKHVIALNIGLISQDDDLTVFNSFNKSAHVEEIRFVDGIVLLVVSSYAENSRYH